MSVCLDHIWRHFSLLSEAGNQAVYFKSERQLPWEVEDYGAGAGMQTGSLDGMGSQVAYIRGKNIQKNTWTEFHKLKVKIKGILDRKEFRHTWGARCLLLNSEVSNGLK